MPPPPYTDSAATLREAGVTTVACLLDRNELPAALETAYAGAGLRLLHFPVPDMGVPRDADAFAAFLRDLLDRLARPRRDRGVDGQSRAAGDEDRGVGPPALVDDVEDRHPLAPRPLERLGDAGDRLRPVRQHHLADRGEVLLLGVDDQERGLGHDDLSLPLTR